MDSSNGTSGYDDYSYTRNPFSDDDDVSHVYLDEEEDQLSGEEEEAGSSDASRRSGSSTRSAGDDVSASSGLESPSMDIVPSPGTNITTIPKMSAARFNRGALIRGTIPASDESYELPAPATEQDLESNAGNSSTNRAPDSDYARHAPKSIWQSSLSSSVRSITENIAAAAESEEDNLHQPQRRGFGWGSRRKKWALPFIGRGSHRFSSKKKEKHWLLIALAVISVLLLATVIAVAVVVSSGGKSGGNLADALTPAQQLLNNIINSVSDKEAFEDERTPQYKARQWFLFEDTMWTSPEAIVSTEKVVQRYALAVFYFATGGPTSWGTAGNNWLAGEECGDPFWKGLSCNDKGQVRTIAFGKCRIQSTPS